MVEREKPLPAVIPAKGATPGNSHCAGRPIAPVVLRIHRWICAAAFLAGIGAGLYYRTWEMIGLFSGGALVGLTFAYMMLASLFGWPGLRWRVFLGDIISYFDPRFCIGCNARFHAPGV